MTLQQVIDLVKKTELKNAAAVKEDTEAILGYINLALIELYKRFALGTDEVIITLGADGTTEYPYIKISDTIYQMPSNYMYLISAYQEVPEVPFPGNLVAEIPVNEEDNLYSVNTVSWNQVQIPAVTNGTHISLIYAIMPKYYSIDELNEELPIPAQLIEAMMSYIGWKGYSSIDPARAENAAYAQRFETACTIALQYGVVTPDDMYMTRRITDRGFI